MAENTPKPLFWIALGIICLGLVSYAWVRYRDTIFPDGKKDAIPVISKDDLKSAGQPAQTAPQVAKAGVEAQDAANVTSVKEYKFVASETLPIVKGVSGYSLTDNTVRMALNVWAGWAPIVHANGGFKPTKVWQTSQGQPFKIELVLIDDPVAMRDAYASGAVQIGWGTVDMLPLLLEELRKDSRTMPRVFQQVDWSHGGDGIVARGGVGSISQLRGKTIVMAQNSPSQFFALNALINGGVQPAECTFKYTGDAFQAAAAFAADKNISAVVSWAPDIYNLSKISGNKMIVSTLQADHLIADVWFARADFAKDNPDIVETMVRGFLDAVEELEDQGKRTAVAKMMADGYNIKPDDALNMLGDAHWTNFAENKDFFLNQNNATNFERTLETAYYLYGRIGKIREKTAWEKIADFSVLQKLSTEAKYAASKNKYMTSFAPKSVSSIQAESGEILTKTVTIHFYPNSCDVKHMVTKAIDGKTIETLYDPNVDFVLEEIGKMVGQYGAARIVVEGHTDGSMRGRVSPADVKDLSGNRAASVRAALLNKFPSISPNQVAPDGKGWDVPADPTDPNNHAKNRRVEVKVYPLEQQ
jgi:NitT/TauT family transport system substrate-binding protein